MGLTYEAANLVPVVPMYSSKTSAIQAVMFISTNMKQTFPEDCLGKIGYPFNMATTVACTEGKVNIWDQSPGVLQANQPPFYMCSNFCRADWELTGSPDGWYNTMHFVFKNITAQAGGDFEDCKGICLSTRGRPGPRCLDFDVGVVVGDSAKRRRDEPYGAFWSPLESYRGSPSNVDG